MYSKDKAIKIMNNLGKNKIPFLFIIDFDINEIDVIVLDEINKNEICYNINGITNIKEQNIITKEIFFDKKPESFENYHKKFRKVTKNIFNGNTYLLNLTCPTPININLTLKEIYLYSSARYKLYYKNKFVVFSPETFVKISDNRISSYPIERNN